MKKNLLNSKIYNLYFLPLYRKKEKRIYEHLFYSQSKLKFFAGFYEISSFLSQLADS